MKYLFLFLSLVAFGPAQASALGSIQEITRALRMSESEPLPEKDYYLSVGERDGLHLGDVVEVFRSYPVMDVASGVPARLIRISLGKLKISILGMSQSVARVDELRPPGLLPALVSPSPMLGDEVELVSRAKSELQTH